MSTPSVAEQVVSFVKKNAQLALLFAKGTPDVRTYYNVRNLETMFGHSGPSFNFGYWVGQGESQPQTIDEANRAMYDLVARWAQISAEHKVLDVGCGFGLADVHFAQTFHCQVTGLNLSDVQLAECERRSRQSGCEITYVHGSATQMPLADASFDRAFSIEAALHFDTRETFLAEAMRVLKPGGRLVLADMVFPEPESIGQRMNLWLLKRGAQVPQRNVYDTQQYIARVKHAGFQIVHTESIAKDVYKPFQGWAKRNPGYLLTISPVMLASNMFMFLYPLDYILVVAEKPR